MQHHDHRNGDVLPYQDGRHRKDVHRAGGDLHKKYARCADLDLHILDDRNDQDGMRGRRKWDDPPDQLQGVHLAVDVTVHHGEHRSG